MSAGYAALERFFRELAGLTRAQRALPPALRTAAGALRRGPAQAAVEQIAAAVEEGTSPADAFGRHAAVFPDPIPELVRAGLAADDLPGMLRVIADHCQAEARTRGTIARVLAYPVVTLAVCSVVAVAGGATAKAMGGGAAELLHPQWSLNELGGGSGRRGRALRSVAEWTDHAGGVAFHSPWGTAAVILCVGVLGWLGVRAVLRSPAARLWCARVAWGLPGIGPVYRASVSARFLAAFGRLLRNGVPMEQTVALLERLFPIAPAQDAARALQRAAAEGAPAGEPLAGSPFVPATVAWLVGGGEARGELPEALEEAAALQQARHDRLLASLHVVWGPLLQIVTGVLVFLLLLTLLTPLAAIYLHAMAAMG